VRELVEVAFEHVDLDWRDHVHVGESLQRGSAELHDLVGDATRARDRLGWTPTVCFEELVRLLVDADLQRLASPVISGGNASGTAVATPASGISR
jgi:GDPmannose 4,6-dehydratase